MYLNKLWAKGLNAFMTLPENSMSPERYMILRRKIIIIMLVVTILPLAVMAIINYHQYRSSLKKEILSPLYILANETTHSFELFLEERLSTVRFIATAYSFEDLSNPKNINKVFRVLKKEFGGFVDLGLINQDGILVSYAGPYALLGKDYSRQESFQEVMLRGTYVSDVFMGYRKFPHIVIAVQHMTPEGEIWYLRATVGTEKYNELIESMKLRPESDVFLVNNSGIMQTTSRFYGNVLEPCRLDIPTRSHGTYVTETIDPKGRQVLVTSAPIRSAYTLVIVKPKSVVLKSWYTMKGELFVIFSISVVIIAVVVLNVAGILVERIKDSDEKRETALHELQHNQKLSSIGRLAAGVAHEINNPLAIINEKAGLIQDIVHQSDDFPHRDKFEGLSNSIVQSIERCRAITHRLLGFARRIEVKYEPLNLNSVITDVLGFLEREALNRRINVDLDLKESLPQIVSDTGQLQQVFLNILNNAFAAVEDGGNILIQTSEDVKQMLRVAIIDDGCGMSDSVRKHIFDPFFSTKKGYGTGLGLSITYGIVKKLGGDIQVQSREGEGSTFTVLLPRKASPRMEDLT